MAAVERNSRLSAGEEVEFWFSMSSVESQFSGLFRDLFPLDSEATVIPLCADDIQANCYNAPTPYHNLSPRYFLLARLLHTALVSPSSPSFPL